MTNNLTTYGSALVATILAANITTGAAAQMGDLPDIIDHDPPYRTIPADTVPIFLLDLFECASRSLANVSLPGGLHNSFIATSNQNPNRPRGSITTGVSRTAYIRDPEGSDLVFNQGTKHETHIKNRRFHEISVQWIIMPEGGAVILAAQHDGSYTKNDGTVTVVKAIETIGYQVLAESIQGLGSAQKKPLDTPQGAWLAHATGKAQADFTACMKHEPIKAEKKEAPTAPITYGEPLSQYVYVPK